MYIAAICTPFPSHLGQMLVALREMKERGCRVELWGDVQAKIIAARCGLGFRYVTVDSSIRLAAQRASRPADHYVRCSFPMVVQQLPQVLRLCREDPPDILHSNARVYTAAIASRLTGIPATNHSCSGMSFGLIPEDLYGFCASGSEPDRQRHIMIALSRRFHEEMDDAFHELISKPFGLPHIENALGLSSELCVLVLSIRELANPRTSKYEYVHFTGPFIDSASPATGASEHGPYCYVTLGTWPLPEVETLSLYRAIVAGIPRRFRIVVGLGGRFAPRELLTLEDRVIVHRYAPQTALIRDAEFVVCHGGCQTVNEALFFGKPILAAPPQITEPREIVHKACQAGACVSIDARDVSPQRISCAVDELTGSPKCRERASALGRLYREAGGHERAVDILEAMASFGNP